MVVLLWTVNRIRCEVWIAGKDMLKMCLMGLCSFGVFLISLNFEGALKVWLLGVVCSMIVSYCLLQINRKMNILTMIITKLRR